MPCRYTAAGPGNTSTPWLADLQLSQFPGPLPDQQVAQAARYIRANILSPAAIHHNSPVDDPAREEYLPFTTKVIAYFLVSWRLLNRHLVKAMVDEAHSLGVEVKPWTVNRMNIVEQLFDWQVDGIITDCKLSVSFSR